MICFIASSFANIVNPTLELNPSKAKPGDEVIIKYNASNSELEGSSSIKALVFSLKDGLPDISEIELSLDGDYYSGAFTVNGDAKALFIKLCDVNEEVFDNNDNKGYTFPLYNTSLKPLPGSYLAMAQASNNFSRLLGVDKDVSASLLCFDKEFEFYPESKNDYVINASYLSNLVAIDSDAAKEMMQKKIDVILTKDHIDSEDHINAGIRMARIIKNKEAVDKLTNKSIELFPNGSNSRNKLMQEFGKTKTLADASVVFNTYNALAAHDNKESSMARMANRLSSMALAEENMDDFEKYFQMIKSPNGKAQILNSIAWGYSGESLETEASNLADGLKYSKMSLNLLEESKANKEVSYYTQKQWEDNLSYSIAMYSDTYALLLYKDGQKEEALKYQQAAVDEIGPNDLSISERYALFLEEIKGGEETLEFLQNLNEESALSPKMSDQFKRLYLANKSVDNAFEDYMSVIRKRRKAKIKEDLVKNLIDLDPISFDLIDMDGNAVSLESYKGKIVILDFWATWCGPCKVSFPGMQAAINHYENDEGVAFLFIDTWESSKNKAEKAKAFITDHEYTFKVLMDNKNEVVAKYGVTGIPTKFVLDTDHRIRFKKVGGSADVEKLVDEISLMVDIIREE